MFEKILNTTSLTANLSKSRPTCHMHFNLPKDSMAAGNAKVISFTIPSLLLIKDINNIRPIKMHNSDRKTMITKAERQIKRPYLCAIQDVKARRTAR